MGRNNVRVLIAIFLIAMGVLVLLNNLRVLPFDINTVEWFWMLVFGLGGVIFLAVFFGNVRDNWWAVIPSFTLIGLSALIGLPSYWNELGGALFLGMIGLSFWVIFFVHREFWWAIIPGGTLLTLAGVAGVSTQLHGTEGGLMTGGIFFLGLAATFMIVYLMPTPQGRMMWAIWPAGILGVMGILITFGVGDLAKFVWPVALMLIGAFILFRAFRPRPQ